MEDRCIILPSSLSARGRSLEQKIFAHAHYMALEERCAADNCTHKDRGSRIYAEHGSLVQVSVCAIPRGFDHVYQVSDSFMAPVMCEITLEIEIIFKCPLTPWMHV